MVGIKIPGSFAPGTVDGFVTEARWIKGTYIVVNTLDDANAIPEGVRVDGTLIYDLETKFEYRWESDTWVIQAKSFADAPKDGKIYARQNGVWTIIDVDSIENSMETISDNLSKLEQQVNEGFQDVLEEVDKKLESYVPRSELSSYAQIELYTYPDAPAEPGDENTLYFIKTVDNGYEFKIWWPSTNSFVTIGSTDVNLDDYYTKAQVDTKLSELEASIPDTSSFATKDELAVVESKIPDVSSFITKSVDDLLNYYLKSETYTKAEVDGLIESVTSISFEVVSELPPTGESNKIYLKLKEDSTNNSYEEYIWIDEKWELIGSTEIDLSNYVTIDNFTSTLETYVKSEDLSNTLSEYTTSEQLTTALSSKQDTLVSGTNVKTINSESILGEGNIQIEGVPGKDGVDGATFTPSVSSEGVISWTNDGGKENPPSQNIKGIPQLVYNDIVNIQLLATGNTVTLQNSKFNRTPIKADVFFAACEVLPNAYIVSFSVVSVGDTSSVCSIGDYIKITGAKGATGEDAPYAIEVLKSTEDPKQTQYFAFSRFNRKLTLGEKFWCYFENITTNIIYLCYYTVSNVVGALDFHADLIGSYRITGTDGEGIPEDGTTGQFLQKTDDGTAWANIDLSSKANTNGTYPSMTVGRAASATNAQRATTAQSATTAESATNATNAVNATTATNAGHATTADSATKATQDANGNVIDTTYVKRSQVVTKDNSGDIINALSQDAKYFLRNKQILTSTVVISKTGWYRIAQLTPCSSSRITVMKGYGPGRGVSLILDIAVGADDTDKTTNIVASYAGMRSQSDYIDKIRYSPAGSSKVYIDVHIVSSGGQSTYWMAYDGASDSAAFVSAGFELYAFQKTSATGGTELLMPEDTGLTTTGTIYQNGAPVLVGDQSAIFESDETTVKKATKATQDGDGNVISTTYVKVNEIPSAEITKQDIADALGCTTSQLDTIIALAQKITVSDSEIVASVRVTAPEFNDN